MLVILPRPPTYFNRHHPIFFFCFETGEQMKNMAQGAAEAVKNTLGMNNATNNASNVPDTNHPSNPFSRG
ncbi:hypothetical protein Gotur_017112 [Gossypium turneri]